MSPNGRLAQLVERVIDVDDVGDSSSSPPTPMLKITLTKNQWSRLSEILGNFGLLTIASVVIPALQGESNILLVILGVVAAILFWYASLITARKY